MRQRPTFEPNWDKIEQRVSKLWERLLPELVRTIAERYMDDLDEQGIVNKFRRHKEAGELPFGYEGKLWDCFAPAIFGIYHTDRAYEVMRLADDIFFKNPDRFMKALDSEFEKALVAEVNHVAGQRPKKLVEALAE